MFKLFKKGQELPEWLVIITPKIGYESNYEEPSMLWNCWVMVFNWRGAYIILPLLFTSATSLVISGGNNVDIQWQSPAGSEKVAEYYTSIVELAKSLFNKALGAAND